jgi:putative FmdB family regulatory protein
MPIYEYQCSLCGHQLEVLQKVSDDPLTECPNCHKASLNKLISSTSFQLKGTGWYVTDFRDKGKPKSSPPKDGESGSSSHGDSGSSAPSSDSGKTGGSETKSNDGATATS